MDLAFRCYHATATPLMPVDIVTAWRICLRLYRFANLLNLDVALGALGSMTLGASVCRASVPRAWGVLLPLAVWATYTLDHLLDGQHASQPSAAPRHQIAARYARPLAVSVGLVIAILCSGGLLLLPSRLLWLAGVVGVATLVHLGAAYAEWYPSSSPFGKELVVAFLYGAGTWGGPLLFMSTPFSLALVSATLTFFLLVLLNLGLFQWFEQYQAHQSCPEMSEGRRASRFLDLGFLGVVVALVGGCIATRATVTLEFFVLVGMGGILWSMRLAPRYFLSYERFRLFGDSVFLVPLLLLL